MHKMIQAKDIFFFLCVIYETSKWVDFNYKYTWGNVSNQPGMISQ